MPEILIRPARPSDKAAVAKISATVWDGNDYLPLVWDGWVAEDANTGFLLAGELNGDVVAIQHTSLQPGAVAWMEGIRVDPAYRNQGIGGQMLARALETARERGSARARLSTARLNQASTAIAGSHGFLETAEFAIFSVPAIDTDLSQGRGRLLPQSEESTRVMRADVSSSDIQDLRERVGEPETLILNQWTAYDLPGQLLPENLPLRYVYQGDGRIKGVALATHSRNGRDLSVAYLGGTRHAISELARELRLEARDAGLESVIGMFPPTSDREAALTDAGYECNEELVAVIFERDL
jgi:ribosomal protein S18 acetylase RimI-like enzyme